MADSIAASTLLLTAITLLYTAWYDELKKARDEKIVEGGGVNAEPGIRRVKSVRYWRVGPLALAAISAVVIFAWPTWRSAGESLRLLFSAKGEYDAVVASLILIWIFTLALAVALIREWLQLSEYEGDLAAGRRRNPH